MSGGYWERLPRRRVSRRRFLLGGGVAAAGSAAILAGCGSDSPAPLPAATEAPAIRETTPPPATEAPEATATPAPSPTPTPSPTPDPNAPRRGGTLRLATWKLGEDHGFDPGIDWLYNREALSPLLTQPLTYQPSKHLFSMDGMVGYEQVDPTTLVWSIRPGMRFHNGDPVDSEAVAYSFGRLAKLSEIHAEDYWKGAWPRWFDYVDHFEATADLTLTEHWRRPHADALVHRSRHEYSFLNPRVVEEQGVVEGVLAAPDGTTEDVYGIQNLPFGAGSGPYILTSLDETGMQLERWPDYHRHSPPDDGFVEDGPYIDAWEFRFLDWKDHKAAFLADDLDVFGALSFSQDEIGEFREAPHSLVIETVGASFDVLGMDAFKFHDRRARLSLQRAIDYEGYIEAFWPAGGKYVGPISDLLPHFQQLSQLELQESYRHNPQEARALWEAAEFSTPLEELKTTSEAPMVWFLAESLQESLGISTRWWMDESWIPPPRGEPRHWDVYAYGPGVGTTGRGTDGTPHSSNLNYFDPLGGGYNAFNFFAESPHPEVAADSAVLTGMLEAQEQELDFDTRVERLTEIQRWVIERAWSCIPLPASTGQYLAFNSRLRDFAPDDWLNFYGLRRESMWLADA